MVFGRGYRKSRGFKPAQLSTNHCIIDPGSSIGGTTQQTAVFTAIEPPVNRGSQIPVGAILKGVDIQLWAKDTTPVNGFHRCLMVYQPGQTTYSDPITAWLSTADPLTEEAIQIRQNKMTKMEQYMTITGASLPPYWRCRWRGNISLRDGDDIVVALLDDNATDWEGICTAWWIS